MKIAIKGNASRGEEVIQILESLGGKNIKKWHGTGDIRDGFFIDSDGIIEFDNLPKGYKLYTLEEFEKEFPFKVGDKVLIKWLDTPFEIIALELFGDELCYKLNNGLHYNPKTLIIYKEMKEERNITLTLDKAKEWYKKGGELKEIALQAFTEKELNPLPRSWEEYTSKIALPKISIDTMLISSLPKKYIALYKLERLRDCWRQGWEPDWNDAKQAKCYICYYQGKFKIITLYGTRCFLSFPTYEMAEEFLECFRDLIEKAGDLI